VRELIDKISLKINHSNCVVFVSGNFNVLHPGHLRLLNFAASCGDFLVIGVTQDSNPGIFISQELRLEAIKSVGIVNEAFILTEPVEEFLSYFKPHIVVKGKEYEFKFNSEQAVVDSYGGKLLFSSGEVLFSSLDLLHKELNAANLHSIKIPKEYLDRHSINLKSCIDIIDEFSKLNVVVVGDLIVDEYITCDALGMSQEDPSLVVTPISKDLFVGGAGIVAGHAAGLGASVSFFSVASDDNPAKFAHQKLSSYGVDVNLILDKTRPTTLKQRFRAHNKTLLRVSHLKQHAISQELSEKLLKCIESKIRKADLLIFSDFNYGCLPQVLVTSIISLCKKYSVHMVADSQSSSQIGDVSRFKDMLLITPTEHEARLAVRDSNIGLVVLADTLKRQSNAVHVFITLGPEGLLAHSPDNLQKGVLTDQLPALNSSVKDVSGAGDCLLTSASLSLVLGASIWESAFIGSVAAACQVSRLGNLPMTAREIKAVLFV
jgi:rfaE bifunctional protein kinase chain/domain